MGKKDNTKTAPRARISHKLARYVRANPVHISSRITSQLPSTTHLTFGGPQKKRLRNNAKTWYPADDQTKLYQRKSRQPRSSTGRKSIQPGNVVILLSGKHRGRRVVVLNSLPSGNLLVSGPFAINGVPLKRVNPAYVISTSATVSLDGVNANIDDAWFNKQKSLTKGDLKNASQAKLKRVEESKQTRQKWREEAKKTQKVVDAKLFQNINKVEHLKGYLGTRFTLLNSSRPHEMRF